MNKLIESLNAWSEAWLPYIVHAGWQGTLVSVVLLAVVLLGRRWPSPLRHAIVVIALLKFLAPPFAASPSGVLSYLAISRNAPILLRDETLAVHSTDGKGEKLASRAARDVQSMTHSVVRNDIEDGGDQGMAVPSAQWHKDAQPATDVARTDEASIASIAAGAPAATPIHSVGWPAYLMLVHLAGSAIFCFALVRQSARLSRLLKRGIEFEDADLHVRYSILAGKLGVRRLPQLLAIEEIESPFSCGVWRRTIVLPNRLLNSASRQEIDLILAHELAHHRRRDLAVNWLQAAVHTLWWFHPVVWILNRQLRAVREDCCDDLLLAAGLADEGVYCNTLLRVAASSRGWIVPSLALRMSCKRTGLARRFRRLMDASLPRAERLSRPSLVLTMLLAAMLLPGLGSGDQTAERQRTDGASGNPANTATKQKESKAQQRAAKPQDQSTRDDSKPAEETSRAWYLLSQTDTSGLLNGLPQRLSQANRNERRSTPVWQGVDNGAQLKVRIETEGKVAGEVLVGFFKDSNWETGEPAQVRSFPGPGEYTVERLMPGKYWVGAMAGTVDAFAKSWKSLPEGAGLGVDHDWPKPLELRAGETAAAHVRVSNDYQIEANHGDQFRGHFGLWGQTKPEQLVTIKTVDRAGKPVPYCSVTIRQLVRGDDTRIDQFHQFGTDENGLAYCDAFAGRFTVSAQKVDFIPELFAMRIRGRQFPTVYQVPLPFMVDVPVDPVPDGSATLSGRVHNQFGEPLREFYLTLERDQKRGDFDWDSFLISMPFTSDDGSYSVPRLPPGEYKIHIRHFDYATHAWRFGQFTVTIPDTPSARVHADFEVEAKELLYGRAAFDDNTPVTKGSWSARFGGQQGNSFAMNINEGGTFRVALSAEEKRKLEKYRRGMVQVSAHLPDKQESTVDLPLDKLSKDARTPATVVLPAKPKPDKAEQPAATKPANGVGLPPDALAWISDLKVLGGEDRTLQIKEFQGKPMYLNLFSTRCSECIETIPELVNLHEQYADKGLVVLVICREDSNELGELVKKHKLRFLVAVDVDGYAVDMFRVGRSEPSYPTNVVLDANQKRVFFEVGFAGEKLDQLHAAIQKALKLSN
ncbi:MAG: M56 family metallopeptidase [Pirellulales bacterium]